MISNVSRRDFLKTSGVAVGGIAIGINFTAQAGTTTDSKSRELNAFVHLAEDGSTTIYSHSPHLRST